MWSCTFCHNKNNNSSNKCHTCRLKKSKEQLEGELKEYEKTHVRDYCPKCLRHEDFEQINKKRYKCLRCHRSFRFSGKPVPETIEV